MNEVLHANIFFVIASVATIIFCILVTLILYHVLKIVRTVRRLVERVEASSQQLSDDVAALRESVAAKGGFVMNFISSILGVAMTKPKRRRRTTDAEDE
jgi:hypothetical protein